MSFTYLDVAARSSDMILCDWWPWIFVNTVQSKLNYNNSGCFCVVFIAFNSIHFCTHVLLDMIKTRSHKTNQSDFVRFMFGHKCIPVSELIKVIIMICYPEVTLDLIMHRTGFIFETCSRVLNWIPACCIPCSDLWMYDLVVSVLYTFITMYLVVYSVLPPWSSSFYANPQFSR